MRIDLHSHTRFSDGALSPDELVMRAQQMQVDVLAITDHDTVDGIEPAIKSINTIYPKLSLISGVEISTWWHGFEIHVLGLGVDHNDETFLTRLAQQQNERAQRGKDMVLKLQKVGVDITLEEVHSLAQGVISRAHLAKLLVDKQVCSHPQQAFSNYLGKHKKAYVRPKWIDIKSAIAWIHDAGGQAVLAHPFHYDMTTKWLRRLCHEFAHDGGDAMEVQHPNLPKPKRDLMIEIANECELLGSAGSDFHAPGRWTELGRRLDLPDTIKPLWHDWF
ncbi:PHP domain-containing protein [Ningiella sp. W23]|uniref:PHP domain-containing protein n=1 Tax=Ningiella sp. W23 TaxID=3023715 RepID=UPI0037572AA4